MSIKFMGGITRKNIKNRRFGDGYGVRDESNPLERKPCHGRRVKKKMLICNISAEDSYNGQFIAHIVIYYPSGK